MNENSCTKVKAISGVRGGGCKRTPKSFDLVKIPEDPGKLCKNLGKFFENLTKIPAKMAPNVV